MAHDISLVKASFVALLVETLLYGTYTVLYFICMYILLYASSAGPGLPRTTHSRVMVFIASTLFLLSTMHFGVVFSRGISGYVDEEDADQFFQRIWIASSVLKQAIYVTSSSLADCLLIYRCYIIWGSRWKIIVIPAFTNLAATSSAYMAVYGFSRAQPGEDAFSSRISKWVRPGYVLTLVTNIMVTAMIAGRIWWLSRDVRSFLSRRHMTKYNQAMAVIIESGMLYSSSMVLMLILYTIKTHAERIMYDALSQIVGIAPTLIIVRVGLGIQSQPYGGSTSGGTQFSTTLGSGGQHEIERGASLHRAVVFPRGLGEGDSERSAAGNRADREQYDLDGVVSTTGRVKTTEG